LKFNRNRGAIKSLVIYHLTEKNESSNILLHSIRAKKRPEPSEQIDGPRGATLMGDNAQNSESSCWPEKGAKE